MFHVKHSGGSGFVAQGVRYLDAGNQHLLAALAKPFQHPALMVEIEFGAEIVERNHRPFATGVSMNTRLGQHTGQSTQLLLAPRKMLALRGPSETDGPVGTMWPAAGMTTRAILGAPLHQDFLHADILRPAALPLNGAIAQFRQELAESFHQARGKSGEIVPAHLLYRFRSACEFDVPHIQFVIAGSPFESRITLVQNTPITLGGGQKGVFHVEHTPIQESATSTPGAGNQFVTAWLETNNRHFAYHATDLGRVGVVDACIPVGIFANQCDSFFAVCVRVCGRHGHPDLPSTNQVVNGSRSETLCVGKQESGFQYAALAGAIRADEDIQPRRQGQIDYGNIAQILDVQPSQPHGERSGRGLRAVRDVAA